MILTEPVTCTKCGAVSVNGGKLACWGCYTRLESELAELRKKALAWDLILDDRVSLSQILGKKSLIFAANGKRKTVSHFNAEEAIEKAKIVGIIKDGRIVE